MKGPRVAILLGGKPKGEDDEEEAPSSSDGDLLSQAFDAIKDDDKEGFVALMRQAINEASMGDEE